MKTLRNAPLFKTGAGRAFLTMQVMPAIYLILAVIMLFTDGRAMPAVWTAVLCEAVLLVVTPVLYRLEKRGMLG